MLFFSNSYLYVSFNRLINYLLWVRELIFPLSVTLNYVTSVRSGFFLLFVLRVSCIISLWHCLGIPKILSKCIKHFHMKPIAFFRVKAFQICRNLPFVSFFRDSISASESSTELRDPSESSDSCSGRLGLYVSSLSSSSSSS